MANEKTPASNAPASSPTPAPKSPLKKRILLGVIGLIAAALLLLLLLPTLLSTGSGNAFILGQANGNISGKIEADAISLGWFSGQSITKLRVLDPDGKTVVSVDKVDVPDAGLFGLATGGRDLGTITVNRPVVNFIQKADGTSNIDAAFAPRKASKAKPASISPSNAGPFVFPEKKLAFTLNVLDGEVAAETPALPMTRIDALTLQVAMKSIADIDIKTSAKITQDRHQGQWNANANIAELFATDGTLQTDKMKIAADADVTGVPIAMVDAMAKQDGKLIALLGEKLKAKLKASGTLASLNADVIAESENLTANAKVTSDASGITAGAGSKVSLIITEAAWEKLTTTPGKASDARLKKPFSIDLTLAKLVLPKGAAGLAWQSAAADVKIALSDVTLVAPAPIGEVALRGATVTALTENLQKLITVTLGASAEQAGQTGKASLTAGLKNAFKSDGAFNQSGLSADVKGSIAALPVALVDELAGTKGLIAKALGSSLNAAINADITPTADGKSLTGPFALTMDSGTPGTAGRPLVVDIKGALGDNTLSLNNGSNIAFTIQPALVTELLATKASDGTTTTAPYELLRPATLKIAFDNLKLPLESTKLGEAAMKLTASLETVALRDSGALGEFTLTDSNVTLTSTRLSETITLSANSKLTQSASPQVASVTAAGSASGVVSASTGKPTPEAAAVKLNAEVKDLPMALADLFAQKPGQPKNLMQVAIGPVLNVKVVADAAPIAPPAGVKNAVSPGNRTTFTIQADAANLILESSGELTPTRFALDSAKTQMQFTLTPEAAKLIANIKDDTAGANATALKQVLAAPAVLTASVPALVVPLPFQDATDVTVALDVKIDQIVPADAMLPADLKSTKITGVSLALSESKLSQLLKPKLSASLYTPYDAAAVPLTVSADVKDATKPTRKVDATAQLDKLPVSLIDAMSKQNGKLTTTLGARLNTVIFTASQSTPDSYVVSAKIESDHLRADLGATYTPGQILSVREGSTLSLLVSPEAYAAWTPKSNTDVKLSGNAPVGFTIRGTQIVWKKGVGEDGKPAQVIDADKSYVGLDMTASANFSQASRELTFGIKDLLIAIDSPSLAKKIAIKMEGSAVSAGATIPGGKTSTPITSKTEITNALGDGLKYQKDTAVVASDTRFPSVPVAAVDAILRKNGDLLDLLGETMSLTMNVSQTPAGGPISLDLKSGNLTLSAKTEIDKDMNARLREDVVASLRITPQIAQKYLAKISPVLKDVKSAKDPVKLTIKKDRFIYPLQGDITKAVVVGSLDLGTMHMQRGEVGGYLVKAMKELGSSIQDREEFDAVFTRAEFVLENGVVTSNDVWFDAGDVIMGTQARVNIGVNPSDPSTEALVGIPGELVRLIPGAHKRVPVTALYEVTGAGPLSAIKYDYVQMGVEFAKIGAAVSGNKTASQIADGLSIVQGVGSAMFGEKDKKEREKLGLRGWEGATWPNRPKTGRNPVVDAKGDAGAAAGTAGAAASGAAGSATGTNAGNALSGAAPSSKAAPAAETPKKDAATSLLESLISKEKAPEKPKPAPQAAPSTPVAPKSESTPQAAPTPAPTPAPAPAPKPAKAAPAPEPATPAPAPAPEKTKPTKAAPEPAPAPAPTPAPEKAKPAKQAPAPAPAPEKPKASKPAAAPPADSESPTTAPSDAPKPAPGKGTKKR